VERIATRGAVLSEIGGRLELQDVELDPPAAGEVLVRLHASGVCHSDLNAVDAIAVSPLPAVLGHEGAGVVEAVGPATSIVPGTHVVLTWMPSCGWCEPCVRDLPHLCRTAWDGMWKGRLLDGTTRIWRDGEQISHYCYISSFAERAVVPERCCVPIPADVPLDAVALVGCAVTTGVSAVWRTAAVRPGERVAVFGCGGIGLSAVMGAAAIGAQPIVAVDTVPEKVDAARDLGATDGIVWAGSAEETADQVVAASGGGVDYAFEATGHPGAMEAAILSTRERGAAVLMGIAREGTTIALPVRRIPRFERRILGATYGSAKPPRDFATIVDAYRRGVLPLDRLVSHRIRLDEAQRGFDLLRSGEALRVLIEIED
jgi:Zn-dependent alcohol dehydrogenase